MLSDFKKYFGPNVSKRLPSCSIEIKQLLNIPNALIVITFKYHPFINQDFAIVKGFSRIPKFDLEGALPIPVIYLMPDYGKSIFKHEVIHACQYLQDNSYPLTARQKEIFLTTDITTGAIIY